MMGTELMRVCVKEENDEIPSVPPGFESLAAFTLKRVQEGQKHGSKDVVICLPAQTASSSDLKPGKMEIDSDVCPNTKIAKSLRNRAWINYGKLDNNLEEPDSSKLNQNPDLSSALPKGVIRGCAQCSNCQKVTARWCPEYARRPDIEDAPVFHPTEEEFEDTLKYIASIRPKAEPYGICRIVPPPSWKPPCPLKEKSIWEGSTFATRVQRVDKLQNRDSVKKMSRLYNHTRKKRRRCMRMAVDCGTDTESILGCSDAVFCEPESFGFSPGPEFTLNTFQKYADDFKEQYYRKNDSIINDGGSMAALQENWEPTVENIEGEYWRIVEKTTEEIEVLYGADLETGVFGSGFPKTSSQVGPDTNERYVKSGWNLNNFPRLPGSVLSYESGDISGVLVPWLYIGMCFSSFCWHVEDHHLYSLNYMHWGAPKMWYGVPGKDATKLEEAMRKRLPDLFEEQPDLLHKLVTQLSPSILKSEGVPVYRCVQNSGEFVLTFPRAYHSGFNCGFNCAEAVNVAPVDWLPHGQIAIELYRQQGRRTSISHDKLLLGAAREAVKAHWELNLLKKNTDDNLRWISVCGRDGILAKALKERVEVERITREFHCNSSLARKMESNFDASSERECSVCLFDLHLSAAGCDCSPDKYACLNHAKQICACGRNTKFFLFRYDVNELNILIEALEGKLSAVYRWAKLDLGLALTSCVSRGNLQDRKLSYFSEGKVFQEVKSKSSGDPENLDGKIIPRKPTTNSTNKMFDESVSMDKKSPPEGAASKGTNTSSIARSPFPVIEKQAYDTNLNKEGSISTNLKTSVCQLSQEDISYAGDLSTAECEIKKPSTLGHDTVILLSDDESDEPKEPDEEKGNSLQKHSEISERLSTSGDSPANENKDSIITTHVSDAAVINKSDVSHAARNRNSCLFVPVQLKAEHYQQNEKVLGSSAANSSCHLDPRIAGIGKYIQDPSHMGEICEGQNMANAGYRHPQRSFVDKPSDDDKIEVNANSNPVENSRGMAGSPSCSQNNIDRYFRQKGPRIAKVVRRINCNVESLELGSVLPGKLWCNSQAIFPKGYRSRVRYISVLDPTNMSCYISEILDAGQDRPLFMVSLENSLSEVFIHVSATRCWEMARERVNQEIAKQHKMGKTNLPPLQPPGSLDGLEMFGFSSPAIVQAIEALDRNRVCTGYWDSRPYSRPQGQIPQYSQSKENGGTSHGKPEEQNNEGTPGSNAQLAGVDMMLRNLLKKANPEELNSLSRILGDGKTIIDQSIITRLINEEIHSQSRC